MGTVSKIAPGKAAPKFGDEEEQAAMKARAEESKAELENPIVARLKKAVG